METVRGELPLALRNELWLLAVQVRTLTVVSKQRTVRARDAALKSKWLAARARRRRIAPPRDGGGRLCRLVPRRTSGSPRRR